AVLLGQGRGLEIGAALGLGSEVSTGPSTTVAPARRDIVSLEEAQRRHIEDALRVAHGQIEGTDGAAALLGINPHTLRARMRKLRIDWSRFRRAAGDREDTPP